MAQADKHIEAAQSFLGEGLQLSRLDQIHDLQHLMGSVIAMKVLLSIAINSNDPREQLKAASKLLDACGENPERVAERLRSSVFKDLSLAQLEAIVQTGNTDPAKAVEELWPDK